MSGGSRWTLKQVGVFLIIFDCGQRALIPSQLFRLFRLHVCSSLGMYTLYSMSENKTLLVHIHITAWQGFSQDFRSGCPKIHIWGELGVQFLFIPLHYTPKIWILGCPKSAIWCPKDTRHLSGSRPAAWCKMFLLQLCSDWSIGTRLILHNMTNIAYHTTFCISL